ncbi:mitochondrial import inner membrane translocase subunit Tim8 A-like [Pollicipes pollicipes]|uniref:mitochondrial import inner membrane translocase subunit Tim8 A-like n=1 Tax=Pollicipes pollicipes TaxID=41117 RepID=UPI001884A3DE|nr:mitochondrial import inner membrane translocase subunit Tim8 A-like [Pollicipes pollicipes]XP_037083241.1 mitochondrial import inner membrane translocase subunit Tim8 A-like [Pollicipes pollicipes]XP_037083242.1 mitochondrial import inner membrane translocase subunit Tim8 A-like [Pollicipes pollicipes]
MSDSLGAGLDGVADPQLRRFIEGETHKQKFQVLVHGLTDQCWDKCMVDRPSTRLDNKTETCLVNCVDRFLDASNYIINRMEKTAGLELAAPATPDFMRD